MWIFKRVFPVPGCGCVKVTWSEQLGPRWYFYCCTGDLGHHVDAIFGSRQHERAARRFRTSIETIVPTMSDKLWTDMKTKGERQCVHYYPLKSVTEP